MSISRKYELFHDVHEMQGEFIERPFVERLP